MVSEYTKEIIPLIQNYMSTKPVMKVWLFGSCSRGEEKPESDVDLMISYDRNSKVSLFTIGGMYMDLKKLLKRDVDLVEEGTLLPFAVSSSMKDRILIYERTN